MVWRGPQRAVKAKGNNGGVLAHKTNAREVATWPTWRSRSFLFVPAHSLFRHYVSIILISYVHNHFFVSIFVDFCPIPQHRQNTFLLFLIGLDPPS